MVTIKNGFKLSPATYPATGRIQEKSYYSNRINYDKRINQAFMNVKSLSDPQLVDALHDDDCGMAFREIYERYWKKMYLLAIRKIADREAVEGIVQDVFLRLWERRSLLQVENLEAYLVTSVKYSCINHFKSAMVHEKYLTHSFSGHSDAIYSTEEQLNASELMNSIEARLSHFPEKSQTIFRLHRLENRSTKEIASEIQMPQRTVEHHLSLVVKALRTYLKEYL
ncbi:RNA polymerase sigma-70 factor [Dyadobacter sp. CY261]|uniref:RNA polymerase sigma-70 factor n=1 Tax=Dyadobacter sp. CY261 TaxID=2907203 RepID=UPI001F33B585|nr:RNA polymerase sigma-70 factor [Dyadobacter sp. CY261]MCF0074698.1 RNA polymerase sigma-70 factor [Dyadobacter sp. CY261]